MSYDWENICKKKTTRELYIISIGKSMIGEECVPYAIKELEKRNFDFEQKEKFEKKCELEDLIEEEKSINKIFARSKNSFDFLIMTSIGAIFILMSCFSFYNFYSGKPVVDKNQAVTIFQLVLGTIFFLFGQFMYKRKKKREEFRKNRMQQLLEEI